MGLFERSSRVDPSSFSRGMSTTSIGNVVSVMKGSCSIQSDQIQIHSSTDSTCHQPTCMSLIRRTLPELLTRIFRLPGIRFAPLHTQERNCVEGFGVDSARSISLQAVSV